MRFNYKIKYILVSTFILIILAELNYITNNIKINFRIFLVPIGVGMITGFIVGRMRDDLELKVKERTLELEISHDNIKKSNLDLENSKKELEKKLAELERFKRLTIDREHKIIELKMRLKNEIRK